MDRKHPARRRPRRPEGTRGGERGAQAQGTGAATGNSRPEDALRPGDDRNRRHLAGGLVWSLPITLSVSEDEANSIREGEEIALKDGDGRVVASMVVEDRYSYDKEREAREVYRTTDLEHPGVGALYRQGEVLLGGEVTLLEEEPNHRPFPGYYYEPTELRKLLAEKGWRRVVGFQTRNPVHRAHEYIQKSALETVDGLLLNPLIGETKSDDISAAVRMKSYEVILERYYPR